MKSFSILGGKSHVVELPEEAHRFKITEKGNLTYFNYDELKGSFPVVRALPSGNWQIVGRLSEVMEQQAAHMVEEELEDGHHIGWKDYETDCMYIETAIESLESAILAEGYYLDENPKRIKDHDSFYDGNGRLKDEEWYMIKCEAEAEAQSRVLCRERTLILKRISP